MLVQIHDIARLLVSHIQVPGEGAVFLPQHKIPFLPARRGQVAQEVRVPPSLEEEATPVYVHVGRLSRTSGTPNLCIPSGGSGREHGIGLS